MKSAEEVAREMIVGAEFEYGCGWMIDANRGGARSTETHTIIANNIQREDEDGARSDVASWLAGIIERSRTEGAAVERERLRGLYGEHGDHAAVIAALAEDL